MIQLNSLLHRNELREIIGRCLQNLEQKRDLEQFSEIMGYSSILSRRNLRWFAEDLLRHVFKVEPIGKDTRRKGELKDFLVQSPQCAGPRVSSLIKWYHKEPERYYRETPTDARIYTSNDPKVPYHLGTIRLKRHQRIAEKGGRRIIERIFQIVGQRSAYYPQSRQNSLAALLRAEEEIIESLRHKEGRFRDIAIPINDVAGMKVIGDEKVFAAVLEHIESREDLELVEKEVHSGEYNAVNLIVKMRIDRERLAAIPLDETTRHMLTLRGLDPERLWKNLPAYLEKAEDDINIEVILTSYLEVLESEIGRCMHEERIIQQRSELENQTRLSLNVNYLLKLLFAVALSRRTDVATLSIKVWADYIPDYIDELFREIYGFEDRTLPF